MTKGSKKIEKNDVKHVEKKTKKRGVNAVTVEDVQPKWYIFRVQTSHEDRIVNSLKSSLSTLFKKKYGVNGNSFFKDFSIPKHNVVKYVNGKKIEKNINAYPGYIFLKIKMTDNVVLFLRDFFRCNGFGRVLPQTISDDRYNDMMDKVNGISKKSHEFTFRIGQRVKINSGSFAFMEGNIESIDDVNKKLRVSVMIFNCETKIDVDYDQVSVVGADN